MKDKNARGGWHFLGIVILIYMLVAFFKQIAVPSALLMSYDIILKIIPVFFLVFVLMALANYYIKPKTLAKYIGEGSGAKGWIIAIAGGIISTGPIYLWYPLLKELREGGVRDALISAFLYNRAIKIAFIPMVIFYFGLKYTIVLTIVMVIASVLQGILTEKFTKVKL